MAKKYASGTQAWGICGRSGRKMILRDMVLDGRFPNMRVDPEWWEDKHPQEYLPKVEDPTSLYRPSPEVFDPPTAPVLTTSLQGQHAQLTWTPAETSLTEIASYSIFRGTDGATPTLLLVCAVLRDFLGGIIGVQHCTTVPSVPSNDDSGSVYDIPTNHDAPVTYVDTAVVPGHTYCYYIVATPMGNNQSVGQGPPSAPSNTACVTISSGTIAWTSRGNVLGSVPAYAMASDTSGTTLLVDASGRVMRSTDGGTTWSLRSSIVGFLATQNTGSLLTANGTWILEAPQNGVLSPAQLFRSTNGGLTWAALSPGFNNAGGIALGTDGAGNWFGIGNITDATLPSTYANSSDDGLTWQFNGITDHIGGLAPPYFVHWTAADKWILLSLDPATSLGQIWQSNDGRTWNKVTTSASNSPQSLLVVAGVYNATSGENALAAASLAGLASATPVAIPLTADDVVGWLFKTSTYWFALDFSGGVAAGTDFATWQVASLSLPLGDFPNTACYDSFHNVAIAAGASGFVVTYP